MEVPRKKILLLENISLNAKTMLEESGFEVDMLKQSLNKEELISKIPAYAVVGVRYSLESCVSLTVRSKSKLDAEVLAAGTRLEAIGCFCIGTDQTDCKKASQLGVCACYSHCCEYLCYFVNYY
jgi:D-3-phosphoglycerate dehydrogenase